MRASTPDWPRLGPSLSVLQAFLACALVVSACAVPNPRACSDGACTDPRYPFCDVEGKLPDSHGSPFTCVSVSCTPGEFAECRADTAVICDAVGGNYDLVQCPNGCDDASQGCRACATDAQCSTSAPVCDAATNSCRGCAEDSECASKVCVPATGQCTPDSAIVVAAPSGSTTGDCSMADPCELAHAVTIAQSNPLRSTVLLLPGQYSSPLSVSSGTIDLVGTGASLRATTGMYTFNITDTANVSIRGMTLDLSALTGYCGGLTGTDHGGTLRLSDVTILLDGLTFNAPTLLKCNATLDKVTIAVTTHGQSAPALFVSDNVVLNADRLHITTTDASSAVVFSGKQVDVHISNSLFENTRMSLMSTETTVQSSYAFFFNTIVTTDANAIDATTNENRSLFVEDNVIVATTNAVACSQCTINRNVTFPETILIGASNIVKDPQFVAATNHDFHLSATSPAVDAAQPSTGFTSTHDFDGVSRPQGIAPDIGAFEHHP